MLDSKRFLGLIPARGGSTRLKNKNIRDLRGQPLISYMIGHGRAVLELDRLVVSTNDDEIAAISREWGAEVPFMRSDALAQSETPMLPAIIDCLERLEKEGQRYDYVVILQANSPLTRPEDILLAMRRCMSDGIDMVFSVTVLDHPPQWSLRLDGDERPKFAFIEDLGDSLDRTQDEEVLYRSTGAIYVADVNYLKANPTSARLALPARRQNSSVIVTDPMHSVDIDTEVDLLLAQAVMDSKRK